MKPEQFYHAYANMPLADRIKPFGKDLMTMSDYFVNIQELTGSIRRHEGERQLLIDAAEPFLPLNKANGCSHVWWQEVAGSHDVCRLCGEIDSPPAKLDKSV